MASSGHRLEAWPQRIQCPLIWRRMCSISTFQYYDSTGWIQLLTTWSNGFRELCLWNLWRTFLRFMAALICKVLLLQFAPFEVVVCECACLCVLTSWSRRLELTTWGVPSSRPVELIPWWGGRRVSSQFLDILRGSSLRSWFAVFQN